MNLADLVVKTSGDRRVGLDGLAEDVAAQVAGGRRVVVVHGGQDRIRELAERLGVADETLTSPSGVAFRRTDPAMLEVVTLALTGSMRGEVLTALRGAGLRAVGLGGADGTVRARRKPAPRAVVDGRTMAVHDDHSGRPESVDTTVLAALLRAGVVPVLSPPAVAEDGGLVNVNADRVAALVAVALGAPELVLLTATDGVRADPTDAGSRIDVLETDARGRTRTARITGGMTGKLVAAADALTGGVAAVRVADGRIAHPVRDALSGGGTRVRLAHAVAIGSDS
ncbi:N-acetylglutamate kinase [Jatrophihabitans endophyticus]|uniref:acetylglutamate kinase n=1 Tax=Jatrophihabitans endophyticus TaxID=1206085 RepID=A0A1M5CNQ8_9ACTN|nr:acetylglutamate kinase [Jatrophihabitans endophyticus]SHF56339.1 N-acetylglutamate kinase [Jatrophihabitans endophyticus]